MKLSEYSDDEIIEEIKHKGIKIEVTMIDNRPWGVIQFPKNVKIGGVTFDIK